MADDTAKIGECAEIAANYRAMREEEQATLEIEYYVDLGLTVQPEWKHRRAADIRRADREVVEIGGSIDAGEDPRLFIPRAKGPYAHEEDDTPDRRSGRWLDKVSR